MATKDDEKREQSNARRRAASKTTPTGKPVGRPPRTTIDLSSSTAIPKLMILGRGQLENRAMHAIRLPPALLTRLRGDKDHPPLVAGPLYLVMQYALERLAQELEQNEHPIVLRAEDFG